MAWLRLVCVWLAALVVGALLVPQLAVAASLAPPTVTTHSYVPSVATHGGEHVSIRGPSQATANPAQATYSYDDFARHTRLANAASASEEAVYAKPGLPSRIAIRGVAAKTVSGGAEAVRIGQAGEAAVRSAFDIGPKVTIQIGGRTRILNGLNDAAVTEVKNVGYQAYTQELKDSLAYAQQTGRQFDLYVRGGASPGVFR